LEFRPMVMQGDVLLYANIIGKLIYNFSRKLNTLNTYFFL
jgi:hypothetical protein